MSVVGIDFGNLNTVVAVARNRGIDVITNETSNRATPSLVSFGEKQRYLGESAKTQEISNFKSTVASLKRLIGRSSSDPEVMAFEKQFVNCNLVEGERGELAASVMYQNEMRSFTFTQLSAMFFGKVKEFTAAELNLPVSDVVISVPGWFTDHQRRAVKDAASIAGLHCLRVMNDSTAAALGYGITKTELPDASLDPNVKPRTVCFVDLGHSSYQVAVVSFTKGKLVVKGTAFDRNLGGRNFDQVLVDHFAEEFKTKYKMDILSNPKATYRLRMACEKVKKILSANAVTVLNVECLMDDKDVSSQVQRQDFEEWIAPLVTRLTAPLQSALEAAGVSVEDIDAVELIGGSTRIPIVKETLAKFFGGDLENNKLSTTLNQDEAVSRGCALQCAILSPVFKVRDFSVQDFNAYPIQLSWDASIVPPSKSGESEISMEPFPYKNLIPSTKMLTFFRNLNDSELNASGGSVEFGLEAAYTDEAYAHGALPGMGKWIGKWSLKGIKRQKLQEGDVLEGDGSKAIIKVKARLDGNGIVNIEQAQQYEEVLVPVTETKAEEPKKEESKKEEEEKKEEVNESNESMDTSEETAPTAETPKTKKVLRKYDLQITAITSGVTPELLTSWQAAEGEMYAADRLVIDTAEKRNALEEYVYETRSKLEMAWSEFVDDENRTKILKSLNEMEEWLYTEEGENATKSVFVENLNKLRKQGDPIAHRAREAEQRPLAEKAFRDYTNSVFVAATSGDDRYSHLPIEDLDKIVKSAQKKLDWLNEMIGKQNELPKHAPLVITCDDINKEKNALFAIANPILTRPKPKVVPKEEKKDDEMKNAEEKKQEMEVD